MSECILCQAIESEKLMKIYEDPEIVVMLHPKPAILGHLIVVPKTHYAILETVPNNILAKAALIANRFSIFLFEALEAKGTNIIIANGLPAGQTFSHFTVNVIPRNENDGLSFQWNPKSASESELSENEALLSAEIQKLSAAPATAEKALPKAPEPRPAEKEEVKEEKKEERRFDYLLKQLVRVP